MELIKIQLRSFRVVVILLLSVLFYFHLSLRKDLSDAQSKIVQLSLRQSSNSSIKEIPELAPRDDVSSDCPSMMNGRGVPTFKQRNELGRIMQSEEFRIGVELGVQKGQYSQVILEDWYDCSEYHLVDLWEHQENYIDAANADQAEQNKFYEEAIANTNKWKEKIHICRNFTTSCAHKYDDEYFDFIYVDARHDFKGVWEDLVAYWPKLKPGGIMAGHDYVTNDFVKRTGQDWSKNYDGTIDETGTVVKGAVDTFAAYNCRQVTVAYEENSKFPTWAMRK